MLVVPLPNDAGLAGDCRPRTHRYRSLSLALGPQLRTFRAAHELTETEVGQVVEASGPSISRWEAGGSAPDGVRLDRVRQLLRGQLWPAMRTHALGVGGFPDPWREAVRWYRRASREVPNRALWGSFLALELDVLRSVDSLGRLWGRYADRADPWSSSLSEEPPAEVSRRRALDVAYGLRWLELAHNCSLDPTRSLVRPIPLSWLDEPEPGAASLNRSTASPPDDVAGQAVPNGVVATEPPDVEDARHNASSGTGAT